MKRTIYLIMMHFASHLYAQGISGYLHINRKPNVNWWAGIIREGHKMPFKNGYEANLYGQCWRNQLQPLFYQQMENSSGQRNHLGLNSMKIRLSLIIIQVQYSMRK